MVGGRRRCALVAILASRVALAMGVSGCGLLESFDGYSDRFDGGAGARDDASLPADGDATPDDTRRDDTTVLPDSNVVDTSIADTLGVDTACDPATCAATKGPLAICSGTSCTCPSGARECGGKCTYTDRDPLNCGDCGKPVADGAHWCVGGVSTCRPGTDECKPWDTTGGYHVSCLNSASCTDMSSDGSHCLDSTGKLWRCYLKDTSGVGPDGRCIAGSCTSSACPSPDFADCPSTIAGVLSCFDIKHDSNNCGACFKQCTASQVCVNGSCAPYLEVKSCADCKDPMGTCCTAWTIPVCVATGAACPVTPGS
jgi:hypothetical protein